MRKLYACSKCGEHHYRNTACTIERPSTVSMSSIALATLLGLTACGDEDKDTSTTDTAVTDTDTSIDTDTDTNDTMDDTAVAVMYGVPDTGSWDNDGDGYTPEDGDCDDNNPDVNPGAREVAGDGVDSNCNGEDDT
jgi:hypothetical protein